MGNTENTEEEYYCPECDAKVNEEDKICPECGANLFELEEYEEGNIVLLKIFPNEFGAQTAKIQLDAAGINSIISSDNEGGMAPNLSLTSGIRLLVNENDFDESVEILKAMDMY